MDKLKEARFLVMELVKLACYSKMSNVNFSIDKKEQNMTYGETYYFLLIHNIM